jgi:hypothetical protein
MFFYAQIRSNLAIEYLNNKVFEANIARYKQSKQDKLKYELIIDDLKASLNRNANVPRNAMLTSKVNEYNAIMKDFTDSQSQLAIAFFTLSENIIRYRKFHFVDVDDAVQEFVMICFEKLDRFDPKKGKAFNYMTTCILNHYRQLYRSARNYNELKKKFGDYLSVNADKSLQPSKAKSTGVAKDKYARYN